MSSNHPTIEELLQLELSTLVEMLAEQINDLSKLRKAEGFAPHVVAAKSRILTLQSAIGIKKIADRSPLTRNKNTSADHYDNGSLRSA